LILPGPSGGWTGRGVGSRPAVVLGSQRLDLPAPVDARGAAYQGRKVIVGIRPEDLIVYGGGGKAARNWDCYERIVATLRRLKNDETLLVQSGKPVPKFIRAINGI